MSNQETTTHYGNLMSSLFHTKSESNQTIFGTNETITAVVVQEIETNNMTDGLTHPFKHSTKGYKIL